jgi:hypothetical protein
MRKGKGAIWDGSPRAMTFEPASLILEVKISCREKQSGSLFFQSD